VTAAATDIASRPDVGPTPRAGAAVRQCWCIVTCEYPPRSGGVSNHTAQIARAFAESGDEVEVWGPPASGPAPVLDGVAVHVLPSHFGPRALLLLRRALRRLDPETRLLVQWVPTAFGWRMMNLAFPMMLASLPGRRIDLYVHEVGWEVSRRETTRRALAGAVHRVMTWLAARSARRVFVTVPAWGERLTLLGRPALTRSQSPVWVPIPSSMPVSADAARTAAIRQRLLRDGARAVVVGHFGTFARFHQSLLGALVPRILDEGPDRVMLLVGRDSPLVRDAILARRPDLRDRIVATGEVARDEVSAHIAACDLMVQPYEDGVSARRSSLMAVLALGRPAITNEGASTEAIWRTDGAVHLADSTEPGELAAAVSTLLADPARRTALGAAGGRLHAQHFDLAHAVVRLRGTTRAVR
jgi:glycosyltransferase involved in cell wall biosynthesis